MRVIAFSDAHIATPDTQKWLFAKSLDYAPCLRFIEMMLADPPDRLLCVGDFCEEWWDTGTPWREIVPEFESLGFERLQGNHEQCGYPLAVEIDGVRYEHGRCKPDTIETVRRAYAGKRVVHGHTHEPQEPWPMDLGSLTLTGTYGEIIDGAAHLRRI